MLTINNLSEFAPSSVLQTHPNTFQQQTRVKIHKILFVYTDNFSVKLCSVNAHESVGVQGIRILLRIRKLLL